MAIGDRYHGKAKERVERYTGEPVEALAWGNRPGAMDAVIAGEVLRGGDVAGGSAIPRGRMTAPGGGKGAKLPINFVVALTPNAVRVFETKLFWGNVKIKKELGTLPRDGLEAAVHDHGPTKQFRLHAADGSAIAFEMTSTRFSTALADGLRAAPV